MNNWKAARSLAAVVQATQKYVSLDMIALDLNIMQHMMLLHFTEVTI